MIRFTKASDIDRSYLVQVGCRHCVELKAEVDRLNKLLTANRALRVTERDSVTSKSVTPRDKKEAARERQRRRRERLKGTPGSSPITHE